MRRPNLLWPKLKLVLRHKSVTDCSDFSNDIRQKNEQAATQFLTNDARTSYLYFEAIPVAYMNRYGNMNGNE